MFKQQVLPLDTQLSPQQLANLMIVEAIEQLQKVTQLSTTHCEQLIAEQFSTQATTIVNPAAFAAKQPLLDSDEFDYINQLF
ncbi:hypothetical protein [Thalassotalea atypica]|uniref:hypothetical protein n=1 Tax=Thalassotalea atypica TaxID=2054316 RepID=UPI0025731558|nr:hypothetical protein [Thalassotalea atypica]